MRSRALLLCASAVIAIILGSETANAATLWRGIVVVSARNGTAQCLDEYDVGESFDVQYRPNLGAAVAETLEVMGANGAMLVSSTDPANLTLRTGSVNITGASYARGFEFNTASNPLTIAPATLTSSTGTISISGILKNAAVAGCSVTFKASLLPVFDAAP